MLREGEKGGERRCNGDRLLSLYACVLREVEKKGVEGG